MQTERKYGCDFGICFCCSQYGLLAIRSSGGKAWGMRKRVSQETVHSLRQRPVFPLDMVCLCCHSRTSSPHQDDLDRRVFMLFVLPCKIPRDSECTEANGSKHPLALQWNSNSACKLFPLVLCGWTYKPMGDESSHLQDLCQRMIWTTCILGTLPINLLEICFSLI